MIAPRTLPMGFEDYQSPPGCVIVRKDQLHVFREYSAMLAEHGIRRLVFEQSQVALAQQWIAARSVPEFGLRQ